mmetsp:Transcript_27270/g.68538  ORF Transcript_27270/g.68538 Transcript_27270/m.68538 type:complete len:87 (-) Transcript_27270:285-545(-)
MFQYASAVSGLAGGSGSRSTEQPGVMEKEVHAFHANLEVGLRCMVREPLLGLSMVEDHVQKSSPVLVRQRMKVESAGETIQVIDKL